jgi:uncharacterized protein (TIGR03000 family)
MFRPSWKYLILGAVLLGTVAVSASQAEACWWCGWHRCYSTCYTPCYTSCYAVSYDPCCDAGSWYLGWRPGPVRRLLFGPYRWYGPWGYWGSYGWQVAGYDTMEAYGPEAQAPAEPTPAERQPTLAKPPAAEAEPTLAEPALPPAVPKPAPKPLTPEPKPFQPSTLEPTTTPAVPPEPTLPGPDDSTTGVVPARHDSGLLAIRVPADAKVVINGLETESTGSQREYVSYGLKPGLVYRYEIRAWIVRNGQVLEDARTVYLTAGARMAVALHWAARPQEAIATLW